GWGGGGRHPPLKSGHRGLFAESLTVGPVGTPDPDLGDPIETATAWVDGRVLVPNERVVYHMRNRAYVPGPSGATAGRFLQRDPNASGAVLYGGGGGLGSHGAAPVAVVTGLDLAGHVGDGVNTYGYLRGQMRGAGDPSGLFLRSVGQQFVPGPGGYITGALSSLVQGYSARQEWDVDWAMDWEVADDWHSRGDSSWVAIAMLQGVYDSFEVGIPGTRFNYNPLDDFAMSGVAVARSGRSVSRFDSVLRDFGKVGDVILHMGYRIVRFFPNGVGRAVIKFPEEAIKLKTKRKVNVSNSEKEIAEANAQFGKPANYKWKEEFGEECVWHHHYKKGELQLIPIRIHKAVGHHHRRYW
ncbi:MAG: HNH endonuclease, partial [bacterium]